MTRRRLPRTGARITRVLIRLEPLLQDRGVRDDPDAHAAFPLGRTVQYAENENGVQLALSRTYAICFPHTDFSCVSFQVHSGAW